MSGSEYGLGEGRVAASNLNDPLEALHQTPPFGSSDSIPVLVREELDAGLEAAEDLQLLLQTLHQLYEHSRAQRERLEQEVAELHETCSRLRVALEDQRLAARRVTRECQQLREAAYVQAMLAQTVRRSRGGPLDSPARQRTQAGSTAASVESLAQERPQPIAIEQGNRVRSQDGRPGPLPFLPRATPVAQNTDSSRSYDELGEQPAATTITVLRVPNVKTAQALYQTLAALPGMADCLLEHFEGGQLVLRAALCDGVTLQAAAQHLPRTNLRMVKQAPEALVLQYL
jgi:hypothetical protein